MGQNGGMGESSAGDRGPGFSSVMVGCVPLRSSLILSESGFPKLQRGRVELDMLRCHA